MQMGFHVGSLGLPSEERRARLVSASLVMGESEAGPSSVSVAREALRRRRQAASDLPADIALRAASLERVRNAKRVGD